MNQISYEQVIIAGIRNLSPERQREVADFVLFLREREENGEQQSANDKKLKAFQEWMESLDPNTPVLTDEQISRESIYEEQILRQI